NCADSSVCISAPDLDAAEAAGTGAVACADHLLRLSLAAVRRPPESPMLMSGDGRARVPEFGADAAVAGVLQHATAFAVADLPTDLTAELKVVTLVVDGPALIRFHVDGVVRAAKHFVKGLLARQKTHVGHPDQRNPTPSIGPHRPVRAGLPDQSSGLAGGHVPPERAVTDNVGRLRGNAFIIEDERTQSRPVFRARIAHDIDNLRSIPQPVQLVEREEAHTGIVGLAAEHAVEFDGMAHGFMDLEPELGAIQDEVEFALGALGGGMQRNGFFRDASDISHQVPFLDQFVTFELVLPTERVRIGAALDF